MSITTTVEAGQIVLPPGVDWPDGTVVRIEEVSKDEPKSLRELMRDFEGIATDLPFDFAAQHDHYIHGHPKK
jgi:hypothetical protein